MLRCRSAAGGRSSDGSCRALRDRPDGRSVARRVHRARRPGGAPRDHARGVQRHGQAKTASSAASGALVMRVSRYTPDFDRKTVEEALRLGGYPRFLTALRNAPEVGQLTLADGPPYVIRYAREKAEGAGRAIVLVTDRPVFFVGSARTEAKPRAGYEVAVIQIQVDGAGRGKRNDGGGGARAPRRERRRAARRLRRRAHRSDQRDAPSRGSVTGSPRGRSSDRPRTSTRPVRETPRRARR